MKTLTFIFFLLFVCMCGADNLLTVQDGTDADNLSGSSWVGSATRELQMNNYDITGIHQATMSNLIAAAATITNLTVDTLSFLNGNSVATELSSNVTYTLTNTQSWADIQTVISSAPRNLGAYNMTFNFSPGSYTSWPAGAVLYISGFYGAGLVTFQGVDAAGTTVSTNYTSYLNITNLNTSPIYIYSNTARILVQYLKVRGYPRSSLVVGNPGYVEYNRMSFISDGTGQAVLLQFAPNVYIHNTVSDNCGWALYSSLSSIMVTYANARTNVSSAIGHFADTGLILRWDTSVVGSTDNNKANGGQISISASTWY